MSFLTSGTPSPVVKFYNNVMDDVLAGVREAFLDEGVDEQVLQELKQMWESKVHQSKAVDPPEIVEPVPPPLQISQPSHSDTKSIIQTKQVANGMPSTPIQTSRTKPAAVAASAPVTAATPVAVPNTVVTQPQLPQPVQSQPQPMMNNVVQDKMVPIQLTLPPPAGSQDTQPRTYHIHVPASALASDQLQRILTPQIISATMALPENVASTLLQQHVSASLQSQANNMQAISSNSSNAQMNGAQGVLMSNNSNNRQFGQIPGNITQIDGTCCVSDEETDDTSRLTLSASISRTKVAKFPIKIVHNKVLQLDGIYDTSDDDEDDDDDDDLDDDDDDENDDKDEEDNDEAENGIEEDPLNSGDDVSEGDNTDLFDTENVVVCQYDKINRSRNKWKFYLKDGIMNLAGRDYIFQKANGDAEW